LRKGLFIFLCLLLLPIRAFGLTAASSRPEDPRILLNGEYYDALQEALGQARREIVLSFFLFKISGHGKNRTARIEKSLKAAVRRGVRVVVLLERSKYRDITDTNEKTAGQLKRGGITVFFDSPKQITHTKVAIIDRTILFLGSHNLTESALRFNNEVSIRLHSRKAAHRLLQYLDRIHPGILAPLRKPSRESPYETPGRNSSLQGFGCRIK